MSHLRTLSLPAMVQSVRYLEAQKTSGQTLSANTWTKLAYDSPSVNTVGITVSSSVFTITMPGLYLVQTGFTVNSSSLYATTKYVKNAAADPADASNMGSHVGVTPTLKPPACRLDKIVYLGSGDTIQFEAIDYSGVTVAVDTASRLRILKL